VSADGDLAALIGPTAEDLLAVTNAEAAACGAMPDDASSATSPDERFTVALALVQADE
jgi:hypothetical protein